MKTKRFISAIAATTAAILPIVSLLNPNPSAATSSRWCWCTDYVAKRFGLTWNFPHAKDWNNGYLQNNGFRQVGVQPGAIVVMEKEFRGADRTYGHVGVVERVNSDGTISVRGANQSRSGFSDSGCNNVTVIKFSTPVNGNRYVSFWSRGNSSNPPSGQKTYFIGDYAMNTNNNFSRIDGYPIMSSWRRNDRDPDQHFEQSRGNWGTLLKHKSTGKCLNAHYLDNGKRVNVWPCNPSDPDQNWALNDLGGGYLQIKRANTNLCLDMPDRKDGGPVHLWQCDRNNPNQRWRTN
ncbi:MAG: ricin-type beta-trefoil lectin domain protein [Coleofasciculus sp. G3-WIS-01]|uniref:ricin-type beta-trefoil lectin domain protein n=1 Tax=Coleofasciculus sp. G3-WIS-01 TaxID=3069528 RepID=UPI0032F17CE2